MIDRMVFPVFDGKRILNRLAVLNRYNLASGSVTQLTNLNSNLDPLANTFLFDSIFVLSGFIGRDDDTPFSPTRPFRNAL